MSQTFYINQKPYKVDSADLIQSGGEGMVFGLGHTAVKLYHQPATTLQNKLQQWFQAAWRSHLPSDVLAPCALVHNKHDQIIGLQMSHLPATAVPIKKLGLPNFWQQQAISTRSVVTLLQRLHQTLQQLHQLQLVVGDLNETNIHITVSANGDIQPFWIDVDSYQFANFACPVAMPAFLDPKLYHVTNFSQWPYFTPLTDWYAFNVLLVKCLLQVHPFGGVHRQHKSLQARAKAGISIFDSSVTYPPQAHPPETLTDDLLHHLQETFEKGLRRPFPLQLLRQYAQTLQSCPHCQLAYPTSRRGCPACSHHAPAPIRPETNNSPRALLRVDGFIEDVFVQPNGRLLIIYRREDSYRLVRAGIGGKLDEMMLFSGMAGYRFGAFTQPNGRAFLVVNPPYQPHLLLLDVHGSEPQRVTLLETALFKGTAVFATTPNHLFRISGGWILRGTVQQQSYLEDTIGTAHQAQTQLIGSPFNNSIAGYHRIFAQHHFFTIQPDGTERALLPPPLPPRQHITQAALTFAPHRIGIAVQLAGDGRHQTKLHQFGLNGKWQQSWDLAEDGWETAVNHYPFHPAAPKSFPYPLADGDKLHHHPAGWLLQQSQQLMFLPYNP